MKVMLWSVFIAGWCAALALHTATPVIVAIGLCLVLAWAGDMATASARRERYLRARASLGAGPSGLD